VAFQSESMLSWQQQRFEADYRHCFYARSKRLAFCRDGSVGPSTHHPRFTTTLPTMSATTTTTSLAGPAVASELSPVPTINITFRPLKCTLHNKPHRHLLATNRQYRPVCRPCHLAGGGTYSCPLRHLPPLSTTTSLTCRASRLLCLRCCLL
jgi:hypothetical protein